MIKTTGIKKRLYFVAGTVSLVLAYIGVIMPGIPGIPFIILTAWFYFRSSDKMYNWLLNHKIFGKLLRKFSEHKTVPLKFKLFVSSQLWVSIIVACIYLIHKIEFQILVVIIGLIVTCLIFRMKKTHYP